MVSAIPRKLGRAVWPSMVTTLVLLAVLSGGRLLLGALPNVQDDIERLLSQHFQFDISIGQIWDHGWILAAAGSRILR